MSVEKRSVPGTWLVLMAAVLWGTTGTTQGLAPENVQPTTIGAIRLAIGGLALMALAVLRGNLINGRRWPAAATALSAAFVATYQVCFFSGVAKTGVAVGTMVTIGSAPVVAGLLAFFIRKEHLGRRWLAATFFAVVGCILLGSSGGNLSADPFGILLALGAGCSYAIYTVSIKGLLEHQSPDAVMAVVFCAAAVLLCPLLLVSDLGWLGQARGIGVALHLGVFATALAYGLFARGLEKVQVGTAATLSLAEPLTATLLGIVVLGERLSLPAMFGVALLFCGIVLLSLSPRNQQQAA